MSNLETTENKSQAKKMDLAGPMLELINFNTAGSNDCGAQVVHSRVNRQERKFKANFIDWMVQDVCITDHDEAMVTTNGLRCLNNVMPAVHGSANTNENHQKYLLKSGWNIMHGERVGIQVLQDNPNQIKIGKKPSTKPAVNADLALVCDIESIASKLGKCLQVLELMSTAAKKRRKPNFNTWRGPRHHSRTDRQLPPKEARKNGAGASTVWRGKVSREGKRLNAEIQYPYIKKRQGLPEANNTFEQQSARFSQNSYNSETEQEGQCHLSAAEPELGRRQGPWRDSSLFLQPCSNPRTSANHRHEIVMNAVSRATKVSYDGAQIYPREKQAALPGSTNSTSDKEQRDRSPPKEQPTTPPKQATLGATEIKCISRPAVASRRDSASVVTAQATLSMIEVYFERFKIAATNSIVLQTRATT